MFVSDYISAHVFFKCQVSNIYIYIYIYIVKVYRACTNKFSHLFISGSWEKWVRENSQIYIYYLFLKNVRTVRSKRHPQLNYNFWIYKNVLFRDENQVKDFRKLDILLYLDKCYTSIFSFLFWIFTDTLIELALKKCWFAVTRS